MPRRCCAGACGASPGAHLTERHEQAGALYRRHRIADQLDGFYRPAAAEYRAARRQVVLLNGVLLMLAAVSGVLAGADVDPDGLWSVLAIAFPAVATALAAYDGVYAFDRVGRLYQDAIDSLDNLEPPEGADPDALRTYVEAAEAIMRREQGQWGQLTSDIALVQHAPGRSKEG